MGTCLGVGGPRKVHEVHRVKWRLSILFFFLLPPPLPRQATGRGPHSPMETCHAATVFPDMVRIFIFFVFFSFSSPCSSSTCFCIRITSCSLCPSLGQKAVTSSHMLLPRTYHIRLFRASIAIPRRILSDWPAYWRWCAGRGPFSHPLSTPSCSFRINLMGTHL